MSILLQTAGLQVLDVNEDDVVEQAVELLAPVLRMLPVDERHEAVEVRLSRLDVSDARLGEGEGGHGIGAHVACCRTGNVQINLADGLALVVEKGLLGVAQGAVDPGVMHGGQQETAAREAVVVDAVRRVVSVASVVHRAWTLGHETVCQHLELSYYAYRSALYMFVEGGAGGRTVIGQVGRLWQRRSVEVVIAVKIGRGWVDIGAPRHEGVDIEIKVAEGGQSGVYTLEIEIEIEIEIKV